MFADDKLLKSAGMRAAEFPVRDFKVETDLPSGNKTVKIVFPWSVSPKIKNFELSGSTYVRPVAKKHKMIIYGDSITQGYDCTRPSASYASRITDFLCADAVNKARTIGIRKTTKISKEIVRAFSKRFRQGSIERKLLFLPRYGARTLKITDRSALFPRHASS